VSWLWFGKSSLEEGGKLERKFVGLLFQSCCCKAEELGDVRRALFEFEVEFELEEESKFMNWETGERGG
jgi:hypothetical protein